MKVKVDPEVCIGCGLCVSSVPAVFRMGENDRAEAYADPTSKDEAAVREAMDACPVSAISEV